jgi:cytochrome P450
LSGGIPFRELRGHWLRGCLHEIRGDPLGLYSSAREKFGDYVRVTAVPGIHFYLLTHPDAVEQVLHKSHRNFRKPDLFNKSVGLLVGKGLFTNEGDSWLSQRRLAQPAFHTQYLSSLCPLIVEGAQSFVRSHEWKSDQPIDMVDAMMKLGLRLASTTLFSADISGEADAVGKAFRTGFTHVSNRMNSAQMIPTWLPTIANGKFARAKRALDRVVADLIASRRNDATNSRDLLAMLMSARDEETGESMPDRLLMDEVITLLTAGHENIGSALSWTWYLLGQHPEIQKQVHDEVSGRLHGRPPTFEDVEHLPLLRAVFEESMRLYPPGWGELRESISAEPINGYELPGKAMVVLCQWVTHRHPEFWEAPDEFKPERFLPPAVKNQHRFAYFPFGGGPRICIGVQLAMLEGILVLATILQRFEVELVADQRIVPDATFTLRPKYGLKVNLHPRG